MSPPRKQLITRMQEEALWDKKLLSTDSAMGLIQAVIFYLCKCFGVWQGKDLKQIKTEHVFFSEDELGKFVTIDLQGALGSGRVMKRYDDSNNPRSVYKILKTYSGYLANDGPFIVRPISSIKDYIVYSPWPLGVGMIEQTIGSLMQESGYGNSYGNVSVCLMAIDILKSFGAGSHCISSWLLRLHTAYKVILKNFVYKECSTMNCEEKSQEACLVISHLLDPPYPSNFAVAMENVRMKKARLNAAALVAKRSSKFNSWLSNIEKTQDGSSKSPRNNKKVAAKRTVESSSGSSSDLEILEQSSPDCDKKEASQICESIDIEDELSDGCHGLSGGENGSYKISCSKNHKRKAIELSKVSHTNVDVTDSKVGITHRTEKETGNSDFSAVSESKLHALKKEDDEVDYDTDEDYVPVSFGENVIELTASGEDESSSSTGEALYDDSLLEGKEEESEGEGSSDVYNTSCEIEIDEDAESHDDLDSPSQTFSDGFNNRDNLSQSSSNSALSRKWPTTKPKSEIPLIRGQGSFVSQVLKACKASTTLPSISDSQTVLLREQTKDSIDILRELLQKKSQLTNGQVSAAETSSPSKTGSTVVFSNNAFHEQIVINENGHENTGKVEVILKSYSDSAKKIPVISGKTRVETISPKPLDEMDKSRETNNIFSEKVAGDSTNVSEVLFSKPNGPLGSDNEDTILCSERSLVTSGVHNSHVDLSPSGLSPQASCLNVCGESDLPGAIPCSLKCSLNDHHHSSESLRSDVHKHHFLEVSSANSLESKDLSSSQHNQSSCCCIQGNNCDKSKVCFSSNFLKVSSGSMVDANEKTVGDDFQNRSSALETLIKSEDVPESISQMPNKQSSAVSWLPEASKSHVDILCPLLRSVLEQPKSPAKSVDARPHMRLLLPPVIDEGKLWKTEEDEESFISVKLKTPLKLETQREMHDMDSHDKVKPCYSPQKNDDKKSKTISPLKNKEILQHLEPPVTFKSPLTSQLVPKGDCQSNPASTEKSLMPSCTFKTQTSKAKSKPWLMKDSKSFLTTSENLSLSSSSSSSSLLDSTSLNSSPNSGFYHYRSDHDNNVAYQTLKIHSTEWGQQTFTIGDIPLQIPTDRSQEDCIGMQTSEISFGDYLPPNTLIPAEAIKLLTRQGANGLEVILKIDHCVSSADSGRSCNSDIEVKEVAYVKKHEEANGLRSKQLL